MKKTTTTAASTTPKPATVKKGTVATQKPTAPKSTPLARTKVLETIKANGGAKIFSIKAPTKKDPNRVFTGRLTPPKANTPQTAGSNVASLGMLRIWDMVNKGWRTVNLQKCTQLKLGGTVYTIK